MRTLLGITLGTFTLLRRDRIFIPALIIGLAMLALAGAGSWWTLEVFEKTLYDFGAASFHLLGSSVALFWGTKIITDSKREGYIEVQLSSPINRSLWILGKFFGLGLALICMGALFLLAWQAVVKYAQFSFTNWDQLCVFFILMLSWMVTASLAIFLASIASQATALFCGLCLWICGLVSNNIFLALPSEPAGFSREIVGFFARVWDLQRFNLSEFAVGYIEFPGIHDLIWRLAYGSCLIVLFLSAACIAFRNRDITS